MTITVVLADDQELVRTGVAMMIDAETDLVVVGQAGDGAEAVALVTETGCDVVVMDIRMPLLDGIEATRRIVAEGRARVLMLTTFDLDEYVFQAFRAGASGFLLKDATRETILEGIRVVASGDALASPSVTRRLVERFVELPLASSPRPELDQLTPREVEVLTLLATGLSNTELAEHLVLSEKTVKTHVGRIFMKLGVRDRVQAVIFAYECGLVVAGGS